MKILAWDNGRDPRDPYYEDDSVYENIKDTIPVEVKLYQRFDVDNNGDYNMDNYEDDSYTTEVEIYESFEYGLEDIIDEDDVVDDVAENLYSYFRSPDINNQIPSKPGSYQLRCNMEITYQVSDIEKESYNFYYDAYDNDVYHDTELYTDDVSRKISEIKFTDVEITEIN